LEIIIKESFLLSVRIGKALLLKIRMNDVQT